MKPLVVFDIDGVLAEFSAGFCHEARRMFRSSSIPIVACADQSTWEMDNIVTPEQNKKVWAAINASHGKFWRNLEPCATPDDVAAMNEVFHALSNWEIAYLTNRPSGHDVLEATVSWLWQYGFPHGEVVLCVDKRAWLDLQAIWYGRRISGILEDSPDNVRKIYEAGHNVHVLDRPYNAEVVGPPRAYRIADFLRSVSRNVAPWGEETEEVWT